MTAMAMVALPRPPTAKTWTIYADDLADLMAHLDPKNAIHVGHSSIGHQFLESGFLGAHAKPVTEKAERLKNARSMADITTILTLTLLVLSAAIIISFAW